MLHRHLLQTSARIGVGANRIATAASMFERHGYVDSCDTLSEKLSSPYKFESGPKDEKIGIVILDDGMQVSKIASSYSNALFYSIYFHLKCPYMRHCKEVSNLFIKYIMIVILLTIATQDHQYIILKS